MNDNHLLAHIGQYALITDNNKVLLLERARSKTWCLPGGRLNEGEDWDVALLREVKEELNLDCHNPKPIAVNVLKDNYQTKYCTYFTLNYSDVNVLKLSEEHTNFGWFNADEIRNLNIEDDKIKKVILDYIEK